MQDNSTEKLVRAVGFWGLVAMCINAVVGSGVFLLPTESYKLLGPFSLWAPLIFALPVFVLVLCFAEAASHFSEPGGAYLYAKTAFGDFVGFETGWMNWLARVTSLAALSNGFVVSLARIFPSLGSDAARIAVILGSLAILTAIHYVGVKYGAASIYVFTLGKVIPLVGFIVVALIAWKHNPIPASLTIPGRGTDWSGGALLSMAGTNSGTVLEGSRMLYAISLGRPRLRAVSYVHPRFRTPAVAILIHVVFAAVLACAGSFAKLAMLSAVARLTTYLFTC